MFKDLLIPPKNGSTRFIFLGGKGGVGKSTLAAAIALGLAEEGYRVLLASTDLQKSQNDILSQEIGSEETKVNGFDNFEAINIDAKESIRKHQLEVIKKIGSLRGDEAEILWLKEYWEKNPVLPCETASYNVFVQYMNSNEYDTIVFDTAPGGHNLDMIGYPWKQLDRLKKSIMVKREVADLTGKTAEIELLEKMAGDNIKAIEKLCSEETSYLLVLHPEMLPVYEAKRIQESLAPYGIPIKGLILNEVLPKEVCTNYFFRERRKLQEKYIALVRNEFPNMEIIEVPLIETEVVGIERVKRIAEVIMGG
ncbi:MAG: ArsA family ATPase [Thaumarchaeota archaeon]|jgi:arsenite-transporting ATPase|nr:ArsA family ATPase [Nitrososphaerota archaeon]